MIYQEAITAIRLNPNESYIGIIFRNEDRYFGHYTISVPDLDDPEYISFSYGGGLLFSSCDDEDSNYSLDDLPGEAKTIFYKSSVGLPDIDGLCSEYALFELFPDLPNPDDIWTNEEQSEFVKLAQDKVEKQWLI